MNVPTLDDWRSEHWSLDTEYAYKNFQGKTRREAVCLFEDNALRYQEDLMYMPSRVFGYYLKAYIDYVLSDAAMGDADGVSCFLALIQFKAEHNRDDIIPLWSEIEPALERLAERQDDFDADWAIYGSFRARIHEVVQRGFQVSFDTTVPEVVPGSTTLRDIALLGGRVFSFPIAIQIFHNSGIGPIELDSEKPDILRLLGAPDAAGGGNHPDFGPIPDWIRYDRPDACIHFGFVGDVVVTVTFMPPGSFNSSRTASESVVD